MTTLSAIELLVLRFAYFVLYVAGPWMLLLGGVAAGYLGVDWLRAKRTDQLMRRGMHALGVLEMAERQDEQLRAGFRAANDRGWL